MAVPATVAQRETVVGRAWSTAGGHGDGRVENSVIGSELDTGWGPGTGSVSGNCAPGTA